MIMTSSSSSSSSAPSAFPSPRASLPAYANATTCSRLRNIHPAAAAAVGTTCGSSMPPAHAMDKDHARHAMISHILGWGIPGILCDDLLQDKVSEIPNRFSSVTEYLDSFQWPLLEETRANIKSSIYSVKKDAPFISLVGLSELPRSATGHTTDHLRIYEAKGAVVEVSASKQAPDFKPNDLLILWRSEAADSIELREELDKEGGGACALALFTSGGDAGEFDSEADSPKTDLPWELRMQMQAADAARISLDRPKQQHLYAVNVTSISTFLRIWQALHTRDAEVLPVPNKILNKTFDAEEEQTGSTLSSKELKSYCASRNLNESQSRAVVCAVDALKRGSSSTGVRLIQGPPGTGKTSTIVPLLSVASWLGMKCLVTAPTNIAVAGAATRLVRMMMTSSDEEKEEQFGEFLSRCFPARSRGEVPWKVLTLGDVVLVGNREKLRVEGSVLEDIYLPQRANMVYDAYRSWRGVCSKMSALLLSCEEAWEEEKENGDKSSGLREFVMARLAKLVEELQKHSRVITQAIPTSRAPDFSTILEHAQRLLPHVSSRHLKDANFADLFAHCKHRSQLLEAIQLSLPQCRYLSSVESIELFSMQNASIVFSTVSTAGSFLIQQALPFSCAIIDEAAQLVEAETAILTCSLAIDKVILVGDPKQLPATVVSQSSKRCGYGRSLMERLMNNGWPCYLLDTQYRMHPSISAFPNVTFYDGRLVDGENVKGPLYQEYESLLYGAYAFLDVGDGEERVDGGGSGAETSKNNPVEAVVVMAVLKNLHKTAAAIVEGTRNRRSLSVGVITPYSSQRELLEKLLKQSEMHTLEVDVNSVDGFQGQERDVIILSTVRANRTGSIGFVKDRQRLNVSMTRARYCFWIVGHGKTLSMKPNVWKDVLENVRARGLLKHAADDPKLLKRIVKAKEDTYGFLSLFSPVSVIFSNKPWKVIFSDDFKKSVFKLTASKDKQMKVLQKIGFLASGRGYSGHSKLSTPPVPGLPDGLVRIKAVADHYLVWSIDVQMYAPVKQIIKIWNLVEQWSGLLNYMNRISAAFRVYSSQYIDRCKQCSANSDASLTLPIDWDDAEDFVWFKSHEKPKGTQSDEDVDNAEESSVHESLLLMKFYALSSGAIHHFLTAEDGSQVNLPFELNKEEQEIIRYPSSCFVLGRSGTGKTTAIVIKLLRREQQHLSLHRCDHDDGYGAMSAVNGQQRRHCEIGMKNLRQMLVTFSPLLCLEIKKQTRHIRRCMSGSACDPEVSPEDELMLLDAEDEKRALGFLPDTLVGMPMACYPMVVTFGKFLTQLENSVPCPFGMKARQDKGSNHPIFSESTMQSTEVDFQRFVSTYWPHLNETLRKCLDASTIFTEIMSVIKGSLQAVKSRDGILGREDYISYRSDSKVGHAPDSCKRDTIYDLFLQYERLKKDRRDHDLADRVWHLYQQLASGEYRGDKIDYIYVDEVQDFTQAQLLLFRFVCSYPNDGFVFAGDTAQVITNGVNFRFQDARSMFYTDFATPSSRMKQPHGKTSDAKVVPRLFQLKHNLRTHMGVVGMANSLIELLYHFFPQSIDKLESETSLVSGQLPVFLETQGQELVKMVFGTDRDVNAPREVYEFGARQVILVRDELQKKRMVDEAGWNGLVLTIGGCKGLEFEDVLIYNFFTESSLKNKWRVLYDYFRRAEPRGRSGQAALDAHPTFDVHRYHLLCSELKHLYVAVTRARQRLWIYEENEFCKPMLDYWLQRCLIERKFVDASFISKMVKSSSPEEWRKTGMELLKQKQFDMAIICFERAGDDQNAMLAKALKLREIGENQLQENGGMAAASLKEAAKLFLAVGRPEHAAKCLMKIGEFQKAGNIYLQKFRPPRFEDAGECFQQAKSWSDAARAFYDANCIQKCLDSCVRGNEFHLALSFIQLSGASLPATVRDGYLLRCAENFHSKHDVQAMMSSVNQFSDTNSKRQFLGANDYIDELIRIEVMEKNYVGAAALAEETKRDVLLAAELLEKGNLHAEAIEMLLFWMRADLLWAEGCKGWGTKNVSQQPIIYGALNKVKALAKAAAADQANGAKLELEAQLELELMFFPPEQQQRGGGVDQDFKKAVSQAEQQSSIKFKLFALWNALTLSRAILHDLCSSSNSSPAAHKRSNGPDFVAAGIRATIELLLQIVTVWNDWRHLVVRCKPPFVDGEDDEMMKDFAYGYFGVRVDGNQETCRVHKENPWWLRNYERRNPADSSCRSKLVLPLRDFERLAAAYWDEQLRFYGNHPNSQMLIRCLEHQKREILNYPPVDIFQRLDLLLRLSQVTTTVLAYPSADLFFEELCEEILFLLWPPSRPTPDTMCTILLLREELRVTEFLDQVAGVLVSNVGKQQHINTFRYSSQLLLLILPYVSQGWKAKHAHVFYENSGVFFSSDCEKRVARRLAAGDPSCTEDFIIQFGWSLVAIFKRAAWIRGGNINTVIGPFHVFLTLLETASLMVCAYLTRLHGLHLPLSMAMSVLCSNGQNWVMQNIIQLQERRGGGSDRFTTPMHELKTELVGILLELLEAVMSGLSPRSNGDRVRVSCEFILRLVVLTLVMETNMFIPQIAFHEMNAYDIVNSAAVRLPHAVGMLCRAFGSNKVADRRYKISAALGSMGEDFLCATRRCERGRCCRSMGNIKAIELMDTQKLMHRNTLLLTLAAGVYVDQTKLLAKLRAFSNANCGAHATIAITSAVDVASSSNSTAAGVHEPPPTDSSSITSQPAAAGPPVDCSSATAVEDRRGSSVKTDVGNQTAPAKEAVGEGKAEEEEEEEEEEAEEEEEEEEGMDNNNEGEESRVMDEEGRMNSEGGDEKEAESRSAGGGGDDASGKKKSNGGGGGGGGSSSKGKKKKNKQQQQQQKKKKGKKRR